MELLTQKQVYNEVGATSLNANEIITKSEAQNIASQKLKRITTDLSSYSDSELLDQFECENQTKVEYSIQVSYDNNSWGNIAQAVFAPTASSNKSSKRIYIKSIKHIYLVNGQKLSEENVDFSITFVSDKFDYTVNADGYSFWPKSENNSNQTKIESFKIINVEDQTKSCNVNLVQEKKGTEVGNGDAIDFSYGWSEGINLDQSTTVSCFIKGVQDKYVGFGTNSRVSIDGINVLGYAGDNTDYGREHTMIDFDSINKYILNNGDKESTVSGKTIKQALTDNNGIMTCKAYLYTVWSVSKGNEINLSCTAYHKKDNFAWNNDGKCQFNIEGAEESFSRTLPANCTTIDKKGYTDPANKMTQSAVITYYFNSGIFSIETNG